MNINNALTIADELDEDGELHVEADDSFNSVEMWLDAVNAAEIIEHLEKMFPELAR